MLLMIELLQSAPRAHEFCPPAPRNPTTLRIALNKQNQRKGRATQHIENELWMWRWKLCFTGKKGSDYSAGLDTTNSMKNVIP